jgi:hypothetical protein
VYNYLISPKGDLDDKIILASIEVDDLNNLFYKELTDRQYIRGGISPLLTDDNYKQLLNNVYTSTDSNFLVEKPSEVPTNVNDYERPFKVVTRDTLEEYVLSNNYWANEVAITALCQKLSLNVIIIKKEKIDDENKLFIAFGNLLTTDCNNWNKYLFLYNSDEHYELVTFNYVLTVFNRKTQKDKLIKHRVTIPTIIYIIFNIYY